VRDLTGTLYEREDGNKMRIGAVGVDHGYLSHRVNAYVKKHKADYVFAVKGVEGVRPVVEDVNARRRRLAKAKRSKAKPELMGVDQAKTVLYRRLKHVVVPGPGYCHFPAGREDEYFLMLTAERKVTTYNKGRAVVEWRKMRARNEALDCRNIAYAVMLLLEPDLTKPQVIRTARPKKAAAPSVDAFAPSDWLI